MIRRPRLKGLTDGPFILPNRVADYRYNDREVQRAFADNCAATWNSCSLNGVAFAPPRLDGGSAGISVLRSSGARMEGARVASPLSPEVELGCPRL